MHFHSFKFAKLEVNGELRLEELDIYSDIYLLLQLLRHGRVGRRPLVLPLVPSAPPLTVGPRAEVARQLRPQRRLPGAQRVEPRQTLLLLLLLPRRGRRRGGGDLPPLGEPRRGWKELDVDERVHEHMTLCNKCKSFLYFGIFYLGMYS